MKLGIVGGGVVGHATARAFMEHAEVRVYDVVPERRTHTLVQTLDTDLVFVCLPTPQGDTGAANLFALHKFFGTLLHDDRQRNYVLRSTVPPGTTRKIRDQYNLLNLVHSPEFLTARCAVTDAQLPARNIIGAQERTDPLMPTGCARVLHCLYMARFPGVPVLHMLDTESELSKLALNGLFAVKVAYFNEVYALCQKLEVDYERVRAGMLSDGRVAHSHTQVPGPDGTLGFGGACLPKDAMSLGTVMHEHKVPLFVTNGAVLTNCAVRRDHEQKAAPGSGTRPQ